MSTIAEQVKEAIAIHTEATRLERERCRAAVIEACDVPVGWFLDIDASSLDLPMDRVVAAIKARILDRINEEAA